MAERPHWSTRLYESSTLETRSVRRSPRFAASIPVWLRREERGRTWEEETETRMLSRYGALLDCRRFVEPGATLSVVRRDNGSRAAVRVAYSAFDDGGRRQLGVEFLATDDFWNLDWSSSAAAPSGTGTPACAPSAAAAATSVIPRESTPEDDRGICSEPPSSPSPGDSSLRPASQDEVHPEPSRGARNDTAVPIAATPVFIPNPKKRARKPKPFSLDETLIRLERSLWLALETGDSATLAALAASELFCVSPEGLTAGFADLQAPAAGATLDQFRVTRLGKQTALVTFLAADAEARLAYHTSLWTQRAGRWVLAFHQRSLATAS